MSKKSTLIPSVIIPCDDIEDAIDFYTRRLGFKLDLIMPSDSPTSAILHHEKNSESRVTLEQRSKEPSGPPLPKRRNPNNFYPVSYASENERWVTGRAGMEYRDLIPDRLGGKVIASHIRLTQDGEVPDYVHYHKVQFQMIYCLRGRIRVVYEDQGPPFWLEPGDCVLQPPEIRHRVLESTGQAEVIEIGMPAVHETWVEHEIELPTNELNPERDFGGQQFVRHIASGADRIAMKTAGLEFRDTGIANTTDGLANVIVSHSNSDTVTGERIQPDLHTIFFVISGNLEINTNDRGMQVLNAGEAAVITPNLTYRCKYAANTDVLEVSIAS